MHVLLSRATIFKYIALSISVFVALTGCETHQHGSLPINTQHYFDETHKQIAKQGDAAYQAGDYQKAATYYKQLIDKEPNHLKTVMRYAESLRLSGQPEASLAYHQKLLHTERYLIEATEAMALAHVQLGNFTEAQPLFTKVLHKDASRWRTINALGVTHSLLGNTEEAMEYFEMAQTVTGDNPTVLNNIGLSLALAEDKEKGLALLNEAASHVGNDTTLRQKIDHNKALVLGISGQMDEAQTLLEKYNPQAAVYNNLGVYAHMAKEKSLAKTYLSMSLATSPVHYPKAWDNLQAIRSE